MQLRGPAGHRGAVTALSTAVLVVLLAGCAGARSTSSLPEVLSAATLSPGSAPSAAGPTGSISPVAGQDMMAAPARRSGPLGGGDMPRPSALGQGWHFRVDNGSQEDGYAGNGTPTVRRDPSEVAGLAVPLGCVDRVDRVRLPRPRWALETDYADASDATTAVVVRLRFATTSGASEFMDRRYAALAACAAQTSSLGPNSTGLVQQLRTVAGLTVSTRTEAGDLHDGSAWTEIARVGMPGTDVMLVAINVPPSAPVAQRAVRALAANR
jgi:hypothetical protein